MRSPLLISKTRLVCGQPKEILKWKTEEIYSLKI